MKRCCFAVVLLVLLAASACDHAAVDPLDPTVDVTSLLLSDVTAADATASLAMPGLLHAAVRKVYVEQGIDAARALVAPLRSLHEQLRATANDGDGSAGSAELQRLHAEEIRLILHVFGDALAGRVIAAVRTDAVVLAHTVAELESAGRTMQPARESLTRIEAFVAEGTAFIGVGDAASALGTAGRAANELDAVRRSLVSAAVLPTVHTLFEDALARLRMTDPDMAERALEQHRALERGAQQAISSSNRDWAHAAVDVVRRDQIRFVLSVLGTAAAERVIVAVEAAYADATADVDRAEAAGSDVFRLERMLDTARDLHARAGVALGTGDAARALDLGSHAANLINAVRVALSSS
jgi:hypothetical protein